MKFRYIFLIILALFVLSACASAEAAPAKYPPLKVGWSLFPGYYPIVIAQEQGFFDKHGVEVEPVFYENYSATLADVQAAVLDGALVTLSDALLIEGRQPDEVRVVLVTDNSLGADGIVATQDITSVAGLQGQKIGANLGTFSELLVLEMLKANGLTASDINMVDINPEAVTGAIPELIQAGHVWEPFLNQAKAQGYQVLFSSADVPGLIPDVLVFQTEVAELRPDEVRAFNTAWFEAVAWWQAHPDEGNAIIAQATGLSLDEISTDGIKFFNLQDNLQTFQPGPGLTSLHTSGRVNADFLISTGVFIAEPNIEQILDPSYLQ